MEDLRNEIITELNHQGFLAELQDENISISLTISSYNIELICKLGPYFPYEFPSVSISRKSMEILPAMPHKYTDSSICTFDRNVSIPNYKNPIGLVIEVVRKAVSILQDGIDGKNHIDYMDEFLEYWKTRDCEDVQLFVDDLSEPTEIYCVRKNNELIASSNTDRLVEICAATLGGEIKEYMRGFVVPTTGNISGVIPKNDIEFLKLIKDNSKYWSLLNSFIQNNINAPEFIVIVSEACDESRMLYGWKFIGPGIPDGFRDKHVNLAVAFSKSKESGKAIAINDCSQIRLYTRGGTGEEIKIKSTCIIGCGSLGGYISEAMMGYGTDRFVLVDNDILTYDNIARHIAGYCNVGLPKVDAINRKLCFHNPNIKCRAVPDNAFAFLESGLGEINNCDLLVLATAYTPLEHLICRMINDGKISVPTLIIWTEPYAIATQAILLNTSMDIFDELFDSNTLEYQYSVIENPEQFNKRESGCQSSYMPYSALDIKMAIYRILEPCIRQYIGNGNNYRFTWCGDLSGARMKDIKLSDYYYDINDYSLEIERLR